MKSVLLSCLFCLIHGLVSAQLSFEKCPLDFSVIPRERNTMKGRVEFKGQTTINNIWISRYKNGKAEYSQPIKLDTISGTVYFNFIDSIDAGLYNYRYELWRQSTGILKIVDSICAGDIYIINGQSNAESASMGEQSNYLKNSFIRTYGNASESPSPKKWMMGSGDGTKDYPGHIGQLGMALANEILSVKHIPIAVFNGGVGGKEINYFLRDEANHSNLATSYGRLLNRMIESKTFDHVSAILWYQGEKDAGLGTSYTTYSTKLQALYDAWLNDFKGLGTIYLYQIRHGCWQNPIYTAPIQQAQLNFAITHPNVMLISTNHINQNIDSCHYNFENGYKILAHYAVEQIKHYQYNQSNTSGIRSILPKKILKLNDYQISIEVDNPDYLFVDDESKNDFFLTSTGEKPVHIHFEEHQVILSFSNPILSNYHLTYLGHSGVLSPSITDQGGHGLASFNNLGDTTFNWNLIYTNTSLEEMPLIDFPGFVRDTSGEGSPPQPPPVHYFKEGFYFYSAYNNLIVESNLLEICSLDIDFFNIEGNLLSKQKYQIYKGVNRYQLPIEKGTMYILRMKAKGKNTIAFKTIKIIY